MRRFIFLLVIMLSVVTIVSCSESDDKTHDGEQNTEEQESIIGTWKDGNYFVSFGKDGFYSAYIAAEFIDSGDWEKKENTVSCLNHYFNRETVYTIKGISDSEMEVEILYTDLNGEENKQTMVFKKTDDEIVSKSNTLSGKSIVTRSSYFGTVTRSFISFNSGVKSATQGSASKYPLNFFYIYIGNTLYHQVLDNNLIQVPSIGGWNIDYNKVKCWKLSFNPNGSIDSFDDVDLNY